MLLLMQPQSKHKSKQTNTSVRTYMIFCGIQIIYCQLMNQREPTDQQKLQQIEHELEQQTTQWIEALNFVENFYNTKRQERANEEQRLKEEILTIKQREIDLNREWVRCIKQRQQIISRMKLILLQDDEKCNKFSQKATEVNSLIQHRTQLEKERIVNEAHEKYREIIETKQSNSVLP